MPETALDYLRVMDPMVLRRVRAYHPSGEMLAEILAAAERNQRGPMLIEALRGRAR